MVSPLNVAVVVVVGESRMLLWSFEASSCGLKTSPLAIRFVTANTGAFSVMVFPAPVAIVATSEKFVPSVATA